MTREETTVRRTVTICSALDRALDDIARGDGEALIRASQSIELAREALMRLASDLIRPVRSRGRKS